MYFVSYMFKIGEYARARVFSYTNHIIYIQNIM